MIIDCVSKAILMFLIYNIVCLMLFGVPESLSQTYYLFKERTNALKVLFPAMIGLLVVFLLPCLFSISEDSAFQFMAFLSMLALLFVGACPAFLNSSFDNKLHTIAAYISAAYALLWIILVTPYWYIILIIAGIISVIAILTKTLKKSYIYWLEMIAFISIFVTIILSI